MYIPIYALAIAGVLSFIFLTPYRQGLIDLFVTVWNLFFGFLRGATPASGTAGVALIATASRIVFAVILVLALVFILFVISLYVLAALSIMAVGDITGHPQAAMYFLIALIIWGIFSTIPAMTIFRPLNWMSRWIARPIVIFLAFYLLGNGVWYGFSCISPRLSTSVGRSGNNTLEQLANTLDKSSLQSENEAGIFALVTENITATNERKEPVVKIPKGTMIKLYDLSGRKAMPTSEGKIRVMLPDWTGQFDQGRSGWIPSRLLDWNWKSNEQVKNPPKTQSDSAPDSGKTSNSKQGKISLMFRENLIARRERPVHFVPGEYTTPDKVYLSRDGVTFDQVGPGTFQINKKDPPYMKIKAEKSEQVSIFEIQ